ncbi:MAG: hypothetical protein ACLGIO_10375 [Acidimicrobiia bacterium]
MSLRAVRGRLVAGALAVAVAACSGGGDGAGGAGGEPAGGGGGGERPAFAFTVTGTEVHAMAPQPPAFPDEVAAKVKAGLDAYLAAGVIEPVRTGDSPSGLERSFTAAALGRLSASAPDRAAVLEEGVALTGEVRQERADAALTALTDPGGAVVVVVARVDMAHTVDSGDAEVAVARSGELVLVDDGGSWKVDAFDVRAARGAR